MVDEYPLNGDDEFSDDRNVSLADLPDNTFGQRLRRMRIFTRRTQDDVALAMGVTTGAYRDWEADRSRPSVDVLPNLADALHLSPLEFFINIGFIDPDEDDGMLLIARIQNWHATERQWLRDAVEFIEAYRREQRPWMET